MMPGTSKPNGQGDAPSREEMQGFIYSLNTRIVQNADVSDEEIMTAIRYQRDLNQHDLERKPARKSKKSAEPAVKLKLEDL